MKSAPEHQDLSSGSRQKTLHQQIKGRILGASNLLSLGRLLLTIPTCLAIIYDLQVYAVVLFFTSALTDYLDGWIARRYNQISDLGKILDPLADKVYVAGAVIVMTFMGIIPLWFLIPVILRDLFILAGGIYVQKKYGLVLPSNWTGKWAVGVLSITLLLMYLGVTGIAITLLIALTFAMLALSLFLYGKRMAEVRNQVASSE